MRSNYKPLGKYIREVDNRDTNKSVDLLLGVSIQKKFMPSIANIIGTDMSTYKIVKRNQFAYGPVTSRNGDKISIALLEDYDEAIVSQAYMPFEVVDTSELDPQYLMMWFRRPEFDRYARFMSHGSAREIFGWEEMCNTELPVPHIDKQREIVKEYNTIVDRINLNNQLIQKLEKTAQAIYKQWFVDFEFPDEEGKPYKSNGGEMEWNEELEIEIPKGWEVVPLNYFLEIKYGKDYKHLQLGTIPLYGSGGIMSYVNKELYAQRSILIPRKGSLNNILLLDLPFWSVDTMFYSVLKDPCCGCYVFYFLKKIDFSSIDVGSAVPSMTIDYLNGIQILRPSSKVLGDFDNTVSKFMKMKELKVNQTLKLLDLKNLLLSKVASIEN
jgi:type I restriction enzyme, S subunit